MGLWEAAHVRIIKNVLLFNRPIIWRSMDRPNVRYPWPTWPHPEPRTMQPHSGKEIALQIERERESERETSYTRT